MLCANPKNTDQQIFDEALKLAQKEPADIVIYSDGSHSYNDNYAGIAAVVVNLKEQKVMRVCAALSTPSYSMAELHAILLGIEEADNLYDLKTKKVVCFTDRNDFASLIKNKNSLKSYNGLKRRFQWFFNCYNIKLIVQKRNSTEGMKEADNFAYEMRLCIRDHLETLKNSLA